MNYKKGAVQRNLYAIVPRPLVTATLNDEGRIVLSRPKIVSPRWRKILPRRWQQAVFRIKLDPIGTAVWQKIDGHKDAGRIAEELTVELGDQIQPVEERLSRFLSMLKQAKLIEF